MKHQLLFALFLISSITIFSQTYVPDDNFEQALIDLGYDDVLDDYVVSTTVSAISTLDVSGKNISDLTGIEDFFSLLNLDCSNNQLTSLFIGYAGFLENLYCNDNQLTALYLSTNPHLTELNCSSNNLQTLSIRSLNNQLLTFFVSINNPELTCISVDDANWSTSNWGEIDPQTRFSENCGVVDFELSGCDDDQDGLSVFDFSTIDSEVLVETPNANISYHTSVSDAKFNINPIVSPIGKITVISRAALGSLPSE